MNILGLWLKGKTRKSSQVMQHEGSLFMEEKENTPKAFLKGSFGCYMCVSVRAFVCVSPTLHLSPS